MIEAVVFDLDGVLLDSEHVWDEVREELTRERGGRWHEGAQRQMMGMSSLEWSRYMHDELGVPDPPEEISKEVVRRLETIYRFAKSHSAVIISSVARRLEPARQPLDAAFNRRACIKALVPRPYCE